MDSVQGLYQRHADKYQAQILDSINEEIKAVDDLYYHRNFIKAYNLYNLIETKIYEKFGASHPMFWLIQCKLANCAIWVDKEMAAEIYQDIYTHFKDTEPKPEYFDFAEACKLYLSQQNFPRAIYLLAQELKKREHNHESEFRIMEVYSMLAKVLFEYECLGPEKDCAQSLEMYNNIYEYRIKLLGQEHPHTIAVVSTLLLALTKPEFENWDRFEDLYRIYFTHAYIDTLNYKYLQFVELGITDLARIQRLIDILLTIVDSREKDFNSMLIIRNISYGYMLLGEFEKAEAALESIRIYNQDTTKPDNRQIPIKSLQQHLGRKKTYAKRVLNMMLKNYISGNLSGSKFQTQKQKISTGDLAQFLQSQGIQGKQTKQAMLEQIEKLKSKKLASVLLQNLLRGQITFQNFKSEQNLSRIPKQVLQHYVTKQGMEITGLTKQQLVQRIQAIVQQKKKRQQQSVPQQYRGIKIDDIINMEQYTIVEFLQQPNKIVIRKGDMYFGCDLRQMILGYAGRENYLFFPRPNQFCIPRDQLIPLLQEGQNIFEVDESMEPVKVQLDDDYGSTVETRINNIIGTRTLGRLGLQRVRLSDFGAQLQQQQQQKQQVQEQVHTREQIEMINHLLQMGYRPRQTVIQALQNTDFDLAAAVNYLSPQHVD
jgi:NACalpha-BTF3-like transcription factor